MYKLIVIGLGKQMVKDHIPSIQKRQDIQITAVVEPNKKLMKEHSSILNVPGYTNLKQALKHSEVDLAIISVPHASYPELLQELASRGIPTLKEKPLAMTFKQAKEIVALYQSHKTYLQICVQRRFSSLYDTARTLIGDIGDIYSFYAEYTLNLQELGSKNLGWRADKSISGGGAALDLGYHTVDLLTYLFGIPDHVYARLNFNSLPGDYTIDDSMKAMMTYRNGAINANMLTTKIFSHKGERIRIFGVKGFVYIDDRKVTLLRRDFSEIESHTFNTKEHEVDNQLDYFIKNAYNPRMLTLENNSILQDQLADMRIIDAIYKSHETGKAIEL